MPHRRLSLLTPAILLVAAPLPALAQSWQATVVAAAPRAAPQAPGPVLAMRSSTLEHRPQRTIVRTLPSAKRPLDIALAEDAPQVDIQPKAEWSDDEGLRVTPTRVAFKRRF